MTPVQQIIRSLESEPGKWEQTDFTLRHKEHNIEIWTRNLPYFNIGIYQPKRNIGFFEKVRLQLALNKWNKTPLIVDN